MAIVSWANANAVKVGLVQVAIKLFRARTTAAIMETVSTESVSVTSTTTVSIVVKVVA